MAMAFSSRRRSWRRLLVVGAAEGGGHRHGGGAGGHQIGIFLHESREDRDVFSHTFILSGSTGLSPINSDQCLHFKKAKMFPVTGGPLAQASLRQMKQTQA